MVTAEGVRSPRSQLNNIIMKDSINPQHYKTHPSGIECIECAEKMTFCLGNALKYLYRCGQKGQALEDLKKARWYLERESARIKTSRLHEWLHRDYSILDEGTHDEGIILLNEERYHGHMVAALTWVLTAATCRTAAHLVRARVSVERMIEIEEYRTAKRP